MKRSAFSMLELIFVIVVMGILAKFGVELFKQSYEGYARSLYINELQTKSTNAVQTLANRLTYRIKDSVSSSTIGGNTVTWKGLDIDGWDAKNWSGIVDLQASSATALVSPGTSSVDGEIFFVGSNVGTGLMEYHHLSDDFTGKDVYEYYKMTDGLEHRLTWAGTELRLDGHLLTDDLSEFVVEKLGDGIHIHLCLEMTGNPLVQGKTCKDKFVF